MSSSTIDLHFGKLYKGYVDRFNQGEGDANFNEAGAFLHSIWFAQFRSPGSRKPHGTILNLIERNHKDFAEFKEAFKTEAMKLQGSNWIYLSKSGQIKTIRNHQKRTDIALLVDWWEHAWTIDYHSDEGPRAAAKGVPTAPCASDDGGVRRDVDRCPLRRPPTAASVEVLVA